MEKNIKGELWVQGGMRMGEDMQGRYARVGGVGSPTITGREV